MEKDNKCPICKRVAIRLVSFTDDGKGKMMCIFCKRKLKKEGYKEVFKLCREHIKEVIDMVETKALKISDFSLDRLRAYANTYRLVAPVGSSEQEEKDFYIAELVKLNNNEDLVSVGVASSGKYKGVNTCLCSKCGQEKAVRPDVYEQRIKKFGSEENLRKSYLCMQCRKK